MMQDEEFGEYAHPKLFTLFDEAIKPSIKEWLGWHDKQMCFTNKQRLSTFYSLLVGNPDNQQPARITNLQSMRQFSKIVMSSKKSVLHRFLEGDLVIYEAMRLVEPEPVDIPLSNNKKGFVKKEK